MSWVIVNKQTNEVVLETWKKSVTMKVNTEKYKVVPIKEWLCGLSQK
jgi:hypothetical protein